jgi:hypothetical protein
MMRGLTPALRCFANAWPLPMMMKTSDRKTDDQIRDAFTFVFLSIYDSNVVLTLFSSRLRGEK